MQTSCMPTHNQKTSKSSRPSRKASTRIKSSSWYYAVCSSTKTTVAQREPSTTETATDITSSTETSSSIRSTWWSAASELACLIRTTWAKRCLLTSRLRYWSRSIWTRSCWRRIWRHSVRTDCYRSYQNWGAVVRKYRLARSRSRGMPPPSPKWRVTCRGNTNTRLTSSRSRNYVSNLASSWNSHKLSSQLIKQRTRIRVRNTRNKRKER